MIVAKHQRTFVIVNALGLHARAAAVLVQTANRFRAETYVEKDGSRVNGKSIMGVLMLAAAKGSEVVVSCEGEDADEAMLDVARLIEAGFGER